MPAVQPGGWGVETVAAMPLLTQPCTLGMRGRHLACRPSVPGAAHTAFGSMHRRSCMGTRSHHPAACRWSMLLPPASRWSRTPPLCRWTCRYVLGCQGEGDPHGTHMGGGSAAALVIMTTASLGQGRGIASPPIGTFCWHGCCALHAPHRSSTQRAHATSQQRAVAVAAAAATCAGAIYVWAQGGAGHGLCPVLMDPMRHAACEP